MASDAHLPNSGDLPASAVARVAQARGCIGPYPCGRGAGANGADLPCACESALARTMTAAVGSPETLAWHADEAEKTADIMFAALTAFDDEPAAEPTDEMVERVMEAVAEAFGACSRVTAERIIAAAFSTQEVHHDG